MAKNKYVEVNNLEIGNYITTWDVNSEFGRLTVMAVDDLQDLPAADVQEVKRGEWEIIEHYTPDGYLCLTTVRCPICKKEYNRGSVADLCDGDLFKCCPNCGARLDDNEI